MEQLIRRYKAAKENIDKNSALKAQIEEYKKRHIAFQKKSESLLPLSLPSFDEERTISSAYWNLMLNGQAKEFFESEKELIQAATLHFEEIAAACEIDFSFLSKR